MVRARHGPVAVVAVGVVVVCLLALAGCGAIETDEPAAPTMPTTPVTTPSRQPAPSPSAAPSQPATPSPTPDTPSPPATPSPGPVPAPGPSTQPSPSPSPSVAPATAMLRLGDEGAVVAALQERLLELGYWLPRVDGRFGPNTHHAVVALQKAAGIARDGIVGPVTERVLDQGVRPRPRSANGTVIEIDRGAQLLLLVTDGQLRWAFDTSTGNAAHLTTPAGWFRVGREVDGYRTSPLGVLYRPKYFNQGIAMHGYPSVPPYPASHGCVRLTNAAMDWLWANDAAPIGRAVWVY